LERSRVVVPVIDADSLEQLYGTLKNIPQGPFTPSVKADVVVRGQSRRNCALQLWTHPGSYGVGAFRWIAFLCKAGHFAAGNRLFYG